MNVSENSQKSDLSRDFSSPSKYGVAIACLVLLPYFLLPLPVFGGKKTPVAPTPTYVDIPTKYTSTPGSLWVPEGLMADLASDYKAHNVNDLIIIRIVEQTTSDTQGNLKSQRQFSSTTAITGLLGQPRATGPLQNVFAGNSNTQLTGQADSSTSNTLNTILAGRVTQVLPNGTLVVEATRELEMGGQKHVAKVHGLVRPGDIAADNSVLSTQIGNLHATINGKGVINDATRAPNPVVRWLLRILSF
jgi:flagellar L-ring protein precursor FlgH